MKRIFIISSLLLCGLNHCFAQSPIGGASVSGVVCTEGQVYTWGLNKQGQTIGTLGTGSAVQHIPTPQQVIFPVGVLIQSIGGLSGGYFLAIDCNSKVWGWGDNGAGQLGLGNKVAQASPQRVLVQAGSSADLAGFRDPQTGQLRNISKVFAGNSSSLAMTDDGRILSWGCNSASCDPAAPGILGNGTLVDANFPTFVLDGATNQPLKNVIDISIGDHIAMALVDVNNEEIGLGTVYTWGDGSYGTLGRNPAGTGNSGNETTGSNVARPVRFPTPTGGPSGDGHLRLIRKISAGDLSGYAIDWEGYVWAWGNGAYNGVTGQGSTISHSDPRRVFRGAVTTGKGSDGTYLLARSVAAGNGFVAAVTLDGRPVSWGGNACASNAPGPAQSPIFACGGNLGNNGVGSYSSVPVFIQNNTGGIHDDVRSVVRGDYWAYYVREDNSVWAWGDNIVGQLGTGGYTTVNRAIPFLQVAAGCSKPDPMPEAKINIWDTTVCAARLNAGNPVKLESGFSLAPTLLNKYEFTWYRIANPSSSLSPSDTTSANIVKSGLGTSFSNYDVVQPGRYWVRIKYKGTNVPCGGYFPAYDYTSVTVFPTTFANPTNLTWCADSAIVRVNQIIPPANSKAIYSYFPTAASTTVLGNSIGNGTSRISVTALPASGNGDKVVFVEETAAASGVLAPIGTGLTYSTKNSNGQHIDTKIVVYEDLTLDSLRFGYLINTSQAGTYTTSLSVSVFGETQSCGNSASANRAGGSIATSPTIVPNISWSANTPLSVRPITIPVNIRLKGSGAGTVYWIGFTNIMTYASTNGNGGPVQLSGIPNFSDNITGNIVRLTASDIDDCAGTNAGLFHNINIKTIQKYCDRKQLVLTSCILTELEESSSMADKFKVYPNPSSSSFILESKEPVQIEVLDLNGTVIENKEVIKNVQVGESWPSGIYFLRIKGQEAINTFKLSKF